MESVQLAAVSGLTSTEDKMSGYIQSGLTGATALVVYLKPATSWQKINLLDYAVFSRTPVKKTRNRESCIMLGASREATRTLQRSLLTLATLMQINTKQSTPMRSFNPTPKKR